MGFSDMNSEGTYLGSVREMLAIAMRETYDAFGNQVAEEFSPDACDTMFEYSGRDASDEELQFYRPRWHDPTPCKWLNVDPVGFEASEPNLYRYVGNEKES